MTPERWQKVRSIVEQALEREPAELEWPAIVTVDPERPSTRLTPESSTVLH